MPEERSFPNHCSLNIQLLRDFFLTIIKSKSQPFKLTHSFTTINQNPAALTLASCSPHPASCSPHPGLLQPSPRPPAALTPASCSPHPSLLPAALTPFSFLQPSPCPPSCSSHPVHQHFSYLLLLLKFSFIFNIHV